MSVVPSSHGIHRSAFNSKPNTHTHTHSHSLNNSFRSASASPRPVIRNTMNPSVPTVVPSGITSSTDTIATTNHSSKPVRQSHKTTPAKGTTATTVVAASQIPGLLTLSKPLEDKFASRPVSRKNNQSHKHQNSTQRTTGSDSVHADTSTKTVPDKDVSNKSPRRSRHKRTKSDGNQPGPTVDVLHTSIPGVTEPIQKRRPKASSIQRSASRTSGRARARPVKEESEEDDSEEWEMPKEKRGTDVLTWQQTSPPSTTSAPTKSTPKTPSPRAQVNRLHTRSISPSPLVSMSTPASTTNLTWQQALFESPAPAVASKKKNQMNNLRRRSSFESSLASSASASPAQPVSVTSPSAVKSAKGHTFPRAHHLAQHNQRTTFGHAKSTSLTTLGFANGPVESDTDPSAKGPLYAGSVFQNSPLADDLPKPRFGLKV